MPRDYGGERRDNWFVKLRDYYGSISIVIDWTGAASSNPLQISIPQCSRQPCHSFSRNAFYSEGAMDRAACELKLCCRAVFPYHIWDFFFQISVYLVCCCKVARSHFRNRVSNHVLHRSPPPKKKLNGRCANMDLWFMVLTALSTSTMQRC